LRFPWPTALSLTVELALALALVASMPSGGRARIAAERYVIPLEPFAPSGRLAAPVNFGYRCTIVDAVAVLNFYGATIPQVHLASRLSHLARYSDKDHGIPWWTYLSWRGQQPLLDQAIEQASREVGRPVMAQTLLGMDFDRAAAAIAAGHPVILNVFVTPEGTPSHSLLAYGFNARGGKALLYAIDPNNQQSYWIGPSTRWSWTVTSTYIRPVGTAAQ
jgi:hypothetical protein